MPVIAFTPVLLQWAVSRTLSMGEFIRVPKPEHGLTLPTHPQLAERASLSSRNRVLAQQSEFRTFGLPTARPRAEEIIGHTWFDHLFDPLCRDFCSMLDYRGLNAPLLEAPHHVGTLELFVLKVVWDSVSVVTEPLW